MNNIKYVVPVRDRFGDYWVMKRVYDGPGLTGGFRDERHQGPFDSRLGAEQVTEQAQAREDQPE